jgi:predicted O-methyltransferase YrrM
LKSTFQVAQENIDHAGLSSKVKIIVGLGHESMLKMHPDIPFDFIFIDADKPGNVNYFTEAKRLVRKGGVIVRRWFLSWQVCPY